MHWVDNDRYSLYIDHGRCGEIVGIIIPFRRPCVLATTAEGPLLSNLLPANWLGMV